MWEESGLLSEGQEREGWRPAELPSEQNKKEVRLTVPNITLPLTSGVTPPSDPYAQANRETNAMKIFRL